LRKIRTQFKIVLYTIYQATYNRFGDSIYTVHKRTYTYIILYTNVHTLANKRSAHNACAYD